MLYVESTQRRGAPYGAGGDQGVQRAQAVREVVRGEVLESAFAVGPGRPDHLERSDELERLTHLSRVSCILYQLHNHESGYGWQFGERREPRERGVMAALDIYKYVGVQQVSYARSRRSARRRRSRA